MSILINIKQFFTATIFFAAVLVTYANISGNYNSVNTLNNDSNLTASPKAQNSEKLALHSISKPITVR